MTTNLTWMLYGKVHAWFLTQIWLVTLLHSLIARRWGGPQSEWRFFPKSLIESPRLTFAICGRNHPSPTCGFLLLCPRFCKTISCLTQLSMKFSLLINTNIPTIRITYSAVLRMKKVLQPRGKQIFRLSIVIKIITRMLCGNVHAWFWTQLWLITLLCSLISWRWVGPQIGWRYFPYPLLYGRCLTIVVCGRSRHSPTYGFLLLCPRVY